MKWCSALFKRCGTLPPPTLISLTRNINKKCREGDVCASSSLAFYSLYIIRQFSFCIIAIRLIRVPNLRRRFRARADLAC